MLGRNNQNGGSQAQPAGSAESAGLHPLWRHFLSFCEELRHGEIERLKIQDGLPVLAEVTTKKIRFTL